MSPHVLNLHHGIKDEMTITPFTKYKDWEIIPTGPSQHNQTPDF